MSCKVNFTDSTGIGSYRDMPIGDSLSDPYRAQISFTRTALFSSSKTRAPSAQAVVHRPHPSHLSLSISMIFLFAIFFSLGIGIYMTIIPLFSFRFLDLSQIRSSQRLDPTGRGLTLRDLFPQLWAIFYDNTAAFDFDQILILQLFKIPR